MQKLQLLIIAWKLFYLHEYMWLLTALDTIDCVNYIFFSVALVSEKMAF